MFSIFLQKTGWFWTHLHSSAVECSASLTAMAGCWGHSGLWAPRPPLSTPSSSRKLDAHLSWLLPSPGLTSLRRAARRTNVNTGNSGTHSTPQPSCRSSLSLCRTTCWLELNPPRVSAATSPSLSPQHLYHQHTTWEAGHLRHPPTRTDTLPPPCLRKRRKRKAAAHAAWSWSRRCWAFSRRTRNWGKSWKVLQVWMICITMSLLLAIT